MASRPILPNHAKNCIQVKLETIQREKGMTSDLKIKQNLRKIKNYGKAYLTQTLLCDNFREFYDTNPYRNAR